MSALWVAVIVTAVGCYALKLSGLSVPQAVLEHPVVERVADLLPVALLAALVAIQVFANGPDLVIDARLAGLAVAVVALLLRAPFLVVVWIYSLPFVRASWSIFEPSSQPGGMDGVFILKSGLLLFCALVGLQAVAMVARCSLIIAGREEFARSGQER